MSERFEKLYVLPCELYSVDSPIVVLAGVLLMDRVTGKAIVQLKFQSVSDIPIKAVKIDLSVFDVSGKELESITEYQYLDLHIDNGQEFGSNKAILLPNAVARSFEISKITVVLLDDNIVSIAMPLIKLPDIVDLKSLNNQELVKQYQLEVGMPAAFVPQKSGDLWRCPCGIWNRATCCSHCHTKEDIVFSSYNYAELTERMNVRLAKEKEEEKELFERQRIESEKKKAKYRIISAITATVCFVVALYLVVTQWLFPKVIIPNGIYSDAEQLFEEGKYSEAKALYMSLGEFNDSKDKINEIDSIVMSKKYDDATQLLLDGKYDEAYTAFQAIKLYKDSSSMMKEVRYLQAKDMLERGDYYKAARLFYSLSHSPYKDSWEQCFDTWGLISQRSSIDAKNNRVACVFADGSITISGSFYSDIEKALLWSDIVSVAMGNWHIVGLHSDGTVEVEGVFYDTKDTKKWKDIVQIAAGGEHTVGLNANGTAIATGNDTFGQCMVDDWSGITMIAAGENHTVGLKSDGTVVAVGDNSTAQCEVSHWRDVVAICASKYQTIGLRADGTVIATKNSYDLDVNLSNDCENWTDIIAIYANKDNMDIVGVKSDGSVVMTGNNSYDTSILSNAIDICLGSRYLLAVRQDGTVAVVGRKDGKDYQGIAQTETSRTET